MYPYSYSCSETPPTLENLAELGSGLAKAIRLQSGERYDVTSACEGSGGAGLPGASAAGSMVDYFYGKLRVPFAYQIKLRDTGSHGFLLPKENIVPAGKEMFSMIKYFSQWILDPGSPTLAAAGEEAPVALQDKQEADVKLETPAVEKAPENAVALQEKFETPAVEKAPENDVALHEKQEGDVKLEMPVVEKAQPARVEKLDGGLLESLLAQEL